MVHDRFFLVGYKKASAAFSRLFNLVLSLLLLVVLSPAFIVIPIIIRVLDGSPVFFAGTRLGRDKKPFKMYKFRTLSLGAQELIGAEILTAKLTTNHKLMTSGGHFLRETRLDELPQLFNVLKGEMDLLGPRPIRPELYERLCKDIAHYDRRFAVNPGLIGYSQLFTPHSSPKKIRNLIDNRFLKVKHNYSLEVVIIFYAFAVLTARLITTTFRSLWKGTGNLLTSRTEKRLLLRLHVSDASIHITPKGEDPDTQTIHGFIKDINEEAVSIVSDRELPDGDLLLKMNIGVKKRGRRAMKSARCSGQVFHKKPSSGNGHEYRSVLRYTPSTPFNYYIIHQYFMRGSIAEA